MVNKLENNTGNKLPALQIIKQFEELKKQFHSIYDILENNIHVSGKYSSPHITRTAVEAINHSMHHLAEREAGFTHKQLMQTAMQYALGEVTSEQLSKVVLAMENAGILFRGRRNDGTLWTTADAVKTEREILSICDQGINTVQPIATSLVDQYCEIAKLNPEQRKAVKAILQSRDKVMTVQGHPGTGKTHMLATVADVLAAKSLLLTQGYEIQGLAPTHTALKELHQRGLKAQTIDSFITKYQSSKGVAQTSEKKKLILIIDEASMVSNKKMLETLQIANDLGCRVIPTGDRRQLQSIEGGKRFNLIQDLSSVRTVNLTNIKRQEDSALKTAVAETLQYDFRAAFTTLRNPIIEVPIQKEDLNTPNWQTARIIIVTKE